MTGAGRAVVTGILMAAINVTIGSIDTRQAGEWGMDCDSPPRRRISCDFYYDWAGSTSMPAIKRQAVCAATWRHF